jgi:hypothetical protein
MFNGNNLLDTVGADVKKFALKVFIKLFTAQERTVGLIIEKASRSEKTPLDLVRVSLLRQAVENKFRITSDIRSVTWVRVKKACNRNCYDQLKKANLNQL